MRHLPYIAQLSPTHQTSIHQHNKQSTSTLSCPQLSSTYLATAFTLSHASTQDHHHYCKLYLYCLFHHFHPHHTYPVTTPTAVSAATSTTAYAEDTTTTTDAAYPAPNPKYIGGYLYPKTQGPAFHLEGLALVHLKYCTPMAASKNGPSAAGPYCCCCFFC